MAGKTLIKRACRPLLALALVCALALLTGGAAGRARPAALPPFELLYVRRTGLPDGRLLSAAYRTADGRVHIVCRVQPPAAP